MTDSADIRFLLTIAQSGSLIATARSAISRKKASCWACEDRSCVQQSGTLLDGLRALPGGLVGALKVSYL